MMCCYAVKLYNDFSVHLKNQRMFWRLELGDQFGHPFENRLFLALTSPFSLAADRICF